MRPLRVLVVDDDEIVCTLLVDMLTRHGHHAIAHTVPQLGLSAARHQDFDLVLLDVNMPGLDGVEALKQMRPLLPKAKFVMITASPTDERAGDAISSGAGLCLAKPFDSDMVEQLLLTLFAK